MRSEANEQNIVTLEPSGHVTAANITDFQQQLTNAVESLNYYSTLIVDMHKVDFLDSSGLMALVCAFRQAKSLGRRFIICSLAPAIKMMFELTQLDRVFEIFDSRYAFELSFFMK